MNLNRVIRSVWFWAALLLIGVTGTVAGYTLYLRQAVDQLVQDQLQASRQLLDILREVRDEESMAAAWPRLWDHQESGKTLEERAASLPTPTLNFQAELKQRYGTEMETLLKDYHKEHQRIIQLPGGKQFWEKLEELKHRPVWFSIHQGQTP
jgi:hypothetical protein